jgi:hypothetical protein
MAHVYYLIISCAFGYFYFQKVISGSDFSASNGINSVIGFSANKPFQFRLLIPLVMKVLSVFGFVPQKAAFLALNILFVYFIVFFYRRVIKEYFNGDSMILLLAPVIVYPMVWNYIILNQSFQYYDIAAVLIFVLGIYFILKDKFGFLVVVFTVGIINKETAVYLALVYVLFNYKILFTKKIFINVFILVFIFLIIKLLLSFIFKDNAGDVVEITYCHNKEIIANLLSNKVYAKNILFSFGGIYIFVLLFFITGKWGAYSSPEYRKKLYMNLAFIPYFVLGIFMVYFTEVRVYAEIIPLFTTLFLVYASFYKIKGFELINK